jgi:hypothetical protein
MTIDRHYAQGIRAATELNGRRLLRKLIAFVLFALVALASSPEAAQAAPIAPTPWLPPDPAYKISVVADGMYRLDYTYLQTAGLPVDTLDPATFQMFWLGQEIAIEVTGAGDGQFNPGDAVVFFGRSVDSLYYEDLLPDHKYTGTNIYWLTYGQAAGKRMATLDGAAVTGTPAGPSWHVQREEQQKLHRTEYPRYSTGARFNPDDDHWFWQRTQSIGNPGSKAHSITTSLPNPAAGSYLATVQARVVGGAGGTHALDIFVNSTDVLTGAAQWTDFTPLEAGATFSQSLLLNGSNTVQLWYSNVGTGFMAMENYTDWLEIGYYRDRVAVSDRLIFNGAQTPGAWQYDVTNLSTADIFVYDVTDLFNSLSVINTAVTGGGPYAVDFSASGDNRRFAAVTGTSYLAPAANNIQLVTHLTSPYTPSGLAVSNGGASWDLRDAGNGADWIVITHRDFWDEIQPLAEWRETVTKYRVAVVDVQEIYDQFNGGLLASEAIQEFLSYAYFNWQQPQPRYVLMAGGGTRDMRPYFINSKPTYVPAFLYPADPILGETASDNRYVMLEGNDILPDMSIGRFPAYAETEITTIVSKTIHYESTPTINDWNQNVLFISDDLDGGGGNFYAFSDILADGSSDPNDPANTRFLPDPYQAIKVYLSQNCDVANLNQVPTECQAMIQEAINNTGALFTSYIGHAQIKNWATEPMVDQALVSTFTNYDQLTIMLAMTCFEGFFHEPANGSRSLAETYIFNDNGGAVASYSPTGFGVATGHDWLEQGFFIDVFQNEQTILGDAIVASKEFLYNNAPSGKYDDLLDTMLLFGDPALQIQTFVSPTAVELAELQAQEQSDGTTLVAWTTGAEADMAAFNVQRSDDGGATFATLNATALPAISSGGTQGNRYTFVDGGAGQPGRLYRIEVLRVDGSRDVSAVTGVTLRPSGSVVFLPLAVRN